MHQQETKNSHVELVRTIVNSSILERLKKLANEYIVFLDQYVDGNYKKIIA